jgi:hypothetical protein
LKRVLLVCATLAALALAFVACTPGPYSCHDNSNCVVQGVQGTCVPTGAAAYCAFPDGKCVGSNLRWDESSAAEVANQCVPAAYSDGGTTTD